MGGSAANPYKYQNLWRILRVGPSDTYDDWTFHDVVEGDVRSEFHVEAEWNAETGLILRKNSLLQCHQGLLGIGKD